MSVELLICTPTGGALALAKNNRESGGASYVRWETGFNCAYGVLENSVGLRRFLRTALARMEKETKKRPAKST